MNVNIKLKMKMNTLTEKDLKYYLGTGLKINCGHLYGLRELTHDYFDDARVCLTAVLRAGYRPLLLPLSALTEPLPDGSIPMHALFPRIDFDKDREDGFEWHIIKNNWGLKLNGKNHNASGQYLSLKSFEYLYANHFWLGDQSLFETGEIIDKRTLK